MLCLSFGFPFLALKEVKSLVSICPGWHHLFCCCQSCGIALRGRNSWPTACTPPTLLQHHWKCSMIFETQLRSEIWCNVLHWIQMPDCLNLSLSITLSYCRLDQVQQPRAAVNPAASQQQHLHVHQPSHKYIRDHTGINPMGLDSLI